LNWERVGAFSGIAFCVLILVVAFGLAPSNPPSTASSRDVLTYLAAHRTALGVANYVQAVAIVLFLTFAATLRERIRLATGQDWTGLLSLAGAVVLVAFIFAVSVTEVALTQRAPENADVSVATLYLYSASASALFPFPIVAFIGGGSLGILRSRALPVWIAWLGLGICALQLLADAEYR
jgi:hypothetical protein